MGVWRVIGSTRLHNLAATRSSKHHGPVVYSIHSFLALSQSSPTVAEGRRDQAKQEGLSILEARAQHCSGGSCACGRAKRKHAFVSAAHEGFNNKTSVRVLFTMGHWIWLLEADPLLSEAHKEIVCMDDARSRHVQILRA
eukprot:1161201-Pelagomonas_calceolata.AAC.10